MYIASSRQANKRNQVLYVSSIKMGYFVRIAPMRFKIFIGERKGTKRKSGFKENIPFLISSMNISADMNNYLCG